jgi:hypothetical protein
MQKAPPIWWIRAAIAGVLLLLVGVLPAQALAQSPPAWSIEEYQRLSGEMARIDEALAGLTPETPAWRAVTTGAYESRRALLAYVTTAIRDGAIPADFIAGATEARIVLMQNIISLAKDLRLCTEAAAVLQVLEDEAEQSRTGYDAWLAARGDVSSCEPLGETPTAAFEAAVMTPPPGRRSPARTATSVVLMVVGAGIGGTVLAGMYNEDQQVFVSGGGLALGVTGLVLLITDPRRTPPRVSATPGIGPRSASVTFRF